MSTEQEIRDLGKRWADAEQRGDVKTLRSLTADDFTLVGPLGFILDKEQWLDRYRTGALVTRSLVWDEINVRDYGSTAVVIGRHTQHAAHQGTPADGRFRGTHVVVRENDRWLLAGIHLSPIAGGAR
jgi:ketosteroid isomerase-like protein